MTTIFFKHTPDMGVICSLEEHLQFESVCQDMLDAGCKWIEVNPNASLRGHFLDDADVTFVMDSDDAVSLNNELSNYKDLLPISLFNEILSRIFWIAKVGWEQYCSSLKQINK